MIPTINKDSSYFVEGKPIRVISPEEVDYLEHFRFFSSLVYASDGEDNRLENIENLFDVESQDEERKARSRERNQKMLEVMSSRVKEANKDAKDLTIWQRGSTRVITCKCSVPHPKKGIIEAFIVSFRGTAEIADAIQDLKSVLPTNMLSSKGEEVIGKVGLGFYDAYNALRLTEEQFLDKEAEREREKSDKYIAKEWVSSMRASAKEDVSELASNFIDEIIVQSQNLPIFVTGHSLGGALTSVCVTDLKLGLKLNNVYAVTFGAPRALNTETAKKMDSSDVDHYRVINQFDPIPVTPPSFLGTHFHWGIPVTFEEINDTGKSVWTVYDHADFHGGEFVELLEGIMKGNNPLEKGKKIFDLFKTLAKEQKYIFAHSIDSKKDVDDTGYKQKMELSKATLRELPGYATTSLVPKIRGSDKADNFFKTNVAPSDLRIVNSVCCITQNLYCSKKCLGCSRRNECCCLREEMCCQKGADPLKCGRPRGTCCQIGCRCWACALVKPKQLWASQDHCCCFVQRAACPSNDEHPCLCVSCFIMLYPKCGICKSVEDTFKFSKNVVPK